MKTIFDNVTSIWKDHETLTPVSWMNGSSDQLMIIDSGHGGFSNNGKYVTAPKKMFKHKNFTFYEGVWNRAVAWSLADKLGNTQRNYIILCAGYNDISLIERVQNVARVAKLVKAKGLKPYVHSIHANAFGMESVNGVEVYTSPGESDSDPLAAIYFEQLSKLGWRMRPDYSHVGPDKEARFTMLTGPEAYDVPAILTETGFYTNEEQAIEMCMPDTIDHIVELMLQADIQIDYKDLL